MKKIIILLPIVIFMLLNAGCTQEAYPSSPDPMQPALISIRPVVTESTSAPASAAISAPTSAPTSAPIPEITKFNFTAEDYYKTVAADSKYGFVWTYDYGNYIAESAVSEQANYRYMCFIDPKTNEVFAVSVICDEVFNNYVDSWFCERANSAIQMCDPALTINALVEYLDTASMKAGDISAYEANGVSYLYGRTTTEDYMGEYITISLKNSTIDPKTLPRKIDKAPDFLAEYCDQAVDLYWSCDYKGLLGLVGSYIDKQTPDETDSAYIIKNLITPVIGDASKCTVKYDKLENDYFIYYKGVESISKSINFVPYMENGAIKFIIGFRASDWLFFDYYFIYIDTDKFVNGFYTDIKRDVLSNADVIEYTKDEITDDNIKQILDSQDPIIRFENSDNDEYKDHKLTSAEKNALKIICEIRDVQDKLTSLVKCWKYS